MSLIEVVAFMRQYNHNKATYEDSETGQIHTVSRKDDGFYIGSTKICDL